MRGIAVVGVSAVLAALLALSSCISPPPYKPYPFGPEGVAGPGMGGQGMMGSQGGMMGQGMMGGQGGMMGQGMMGSQGGMMGQGMMGGPSNPQAKPITIDQAADSVHRYLKASGQKLSLVEVMEFAWNFYAEVEEEDTGVHALELLIDKYTGQVYLEMGPNMMWNTKYGMIAQTTGSFYMAGAPTAAMPVPPELAKALAQQFLDAKLPGVGLGKADTFYGYYTLHTLRNGQVEGMLSVNGYTGAVWYHTWHGPFIGKKDFPRG